MIVNFPEEARRTNGQYHNLVGRLCLDNGGHQF